jgi:hypothetical protein
MRIIADMTDPVVIHKIFKLLRGPRRLQPVNAAQLRSEV